MKGKMMRKNKEKERGRGEKIDKKTVGEKGKREGKFMR